MNTKCKNPYLDNSIYGKYVFLFGHKMLDLDLNIADGGYGYNKIGAVVVELTTKEMYDNCPNKQVSFYEFMPEFIPECIPEGMIYNKELDKLVLDINEPIKLVPDIACQNGFNSKPVQTPFLKSVSIDKLQEALHKHIKIQQESTSKRQNEMKTKVQQLVHATDKFCNTSFSFEQEWAKKNVADEYTKAIDLKKETISKRENGFIKADLGKLDFSLVDPFAYSDLAFQLTVGAEKYNKDNWKKGDMNIYLSALERHIQDIKKALDEDDVEKLIDDTGIQHGGALLCNSMFIHYFIRQILKDKNVK